MIERYTLSKIGRIWSDQRKLEIMLNIEILACEAMAKLGQIPKQAVDNIRKNAKFDLDEVRRLEEKTKHDVVAFIQNIGESLGSDAQYLHMGLTSSDLLDTALSVQCIEAADIIIADLKKLLAVLKVRAKKYKDTHCIAR